MPAEMLAAAKREAPAIEGTWAMDFDTRWFGQVRTTARFRVDEKEGRVVASSRAGALGDLVGGVPALLVQVFASMFPDGALLRIEGKLAMDAEGGVRIDGRIPTPVGPSRIDLRVADDAMTGELYEPWEGRWFGRVRAERVEDGASGARGAEYGQLARLARERMEGAYFRPNELTERRWEKFWDNVGKRFEKAQDDIEVLGGFMLEREELGQRQMSIFRRGAAMNEAMAGAGTKDANGAPRKNWNVRRLDWGAVLLEVDEIPRNSDAWVEEALGAVRTAIEETEPARTMVDQFGSTTEVRIGGEEGQRGVWAGEKPILIDLRNAFGGSVSAAAQIASFFLEEPVEAGTFAGRGWWVSHEAAPKLGEAAESSEFVRVDLKETWAVRTALAANPQAAGAIGVIGAEGHAVMNPVYVLVSKDTAQAAELLASVLQESKRGRVVGERTAGVFLVTEEYGLGGTGWSMRVPTASFARSDGSAIDGKGVEPDVKSEAGMAVAAAEAVEMIRRGEGKD